MVEVDAGNGKLLARLRGWGNVVDVAYVDGTARVTVRLPARHFGPVRREGGALFEVDGRPIPPEVEPWAPPSTPAAP